MSAKKAAKILFLCAGATFILFVLGAITNLLFIKLAGICVFAIGIFIAITHPLICPHCGKFVRFGAGVLTRDCFYCPFCGEMIDLDKKN